MMSNIISFQKHENLINVLNDKIRKSHIQNGVSYGKKATNIMCLNQALRDQGKTQVFNN